MSSSSGKPRYNWRGKIIVKSLVTNRQGHKGKIEQMSDKGKNSNSKGSKKRLNQKKEVSLLSLVSKSISSSLVTMESIFLCLRNLRKKAVGYGQLLRS